MSLTETHHAFASIDEHGVNVALQTFFHARPHYLHYGSPPFVLADSVLATHVDPIAFPGTGSGIAFAVDLLIPTVDLYPPDGSLPPPLTLGPGQVSIATEVLLTIGCTAGVENGRGGQVTPLKTILKVLAVGHPVSVYFSPGVGYVTFVVDQVLLPDVQPESLQAVIDCLIRMILNAVLSSVQLSFDVIDVKFFKVSLEEGPTVADNQIKIWGDAS